MKCPLCGSIESVFVMNSKTQLQKDNKIFQFDSCLHCNSIYLKNPPIEDELKKYYTDNYLPYSTSKPWGRYTFIVNIWQSIVDSKKCKLLTKHTKNKKIVRVLDFGCGKPTFLKKLSNYYQGDFVGFDFSDLGWKDCQQQFLKLKLFSNEFEKIQEKFDVITLWHSLEHHFRPVELLTQLKSKLNSKGIIIIELPNYKSFFANRQKGDWGGLHTPRHSVIYSPESLIFLMQENGFQIKKILKYGSLDAFTLWWLGRASNYNIYNSLYPFENLFIKFCLLKVLTFPFFVFEKYLNLGVMTFVCEKKE
ncbi:class I SAM-dependent methyltransferase [Pigmentibacter sp. JX0631]|uniref:class I SAM-dependent methyltransferase n=1 Tax=Pigmentibacter sp. JX0631 TaxID=2976982 RepID=UPI002468378B|nr:class I SAM-dependent methyltransferase [Pigmentibacter sp. JX0631]WGL58589.1 class I SAM-dependent methyltransferase [Pigmentibacter sp. JX0631]